MSDVLFNTQTQLPDIIHYSTQTIIHIHIWPRLIQCLIATGNKIKTWNLWRIAADGQRSNIITPDNNLTENSMFFLSWLTARGSGTGSVCFRMDTDSPVRMDWSTLRVVEHMEVSRMSAGTLSPTEEKQVQKKRLVSFFLSGMLCDKNSKGIKDIHILQKHNILSNRQTFFYLIIIPSFFFYERYFLELLMKLWCLLKMFQIAIILNT